MSTAKKKTYTQFSKRLAMLVALSWISFRLIAMLFILLKPETGTSIQALQQGADDVLIVAIGFYNGNSVAEKAILNYFQTKTASSSTSTEEDVG